MFSQSFLLATVLIALSLTLFLLTYLWLTFCAFRENFWCGLASIVLFPWGGFYYLEKVSEKHHLPVYCLTVAYVTALLGLAFLEFE